MTRKFSFRIIEYGRLHVGCIWTTSMNGTLQKADRRLLTMRYTFYVVGRFPQPI